MILVNSCVTKANYKKLILRPHPYFGVIIIFLDNVKS
jgi:hypothetical protein